MDLLILIMLEILYIFLLVFYIRTFDKLSIGSWILIYIMVGIIASGWTAILSEVGISYV